MTQPTGTLADAWQLSRSGQFDAALALANDLVASAPDNPNALRLLATLTLQNGDHHQALALFERVLTLSGASPETLADLAEAQRQAGHLASALDSFQRALMLRPRDATALRGLAQCQHELGNHGEALASFRGVLKLLPYDKYAAHMVAVLSGSGSAASTAYVADLFDAHADDFDARLVGVLRYDIPNRIAGLVLPHAPSSVLDLGCGTGLVGAALHKAGIDPVIDGVDIAPQMIRKAAVRGLYRHLRIGDATDLLAHDPALAGPYDLVTAADVFVYLGPLEAIFAAVTMVLSPTGLFAFSVEASDTGDVTLRSSGRFAHGTDYVTRLAAHHGLTIVEALDTPIREERNQPIPGRLYLLGR